MWRLRRFPLVLMQDGCRAIGELPSPLWAGLSHMLRMVPLARTRRICPLPLRERATRWFSADEGVRGRYTVLSEAPPLTHHDVLRYRHALSRKGRGRICQRPTI